MGVYYPQRSRTVEGEWHTVYIETNVPYWTVKWYVDGKLKEIQTNSFGSTDSYFSYQYPWLGSSNGSNIPVKAVATTFLYEDSDEINLTVFSDNDFLWRKSIARVESISHAVGHSYIFTSGHIIEYYNDRKRPFLAFMRRKARWFRDGFARDANWPADAEFTPDTTFWGSFSMSMDTSETLEAGRDYEVEAYTNMTGEEMATVLSESARYDPEADDPLPIPTGVEDVNENEGLPVEIR